MSDVNKQLLEAVKEFFDAEQSEGREKFGHFYKPATREHQQRELIARAKLHEAIAAAEQAQQSKAVTLEQLVANLKAGENGDAISAAMDQACADMELGRRMREQAQQAEPRCACGDSFTSDAVCANCLADQQQAEPVARDVLMKFGEEVYDKTFWACRDGDWSINLPAIVDRYATQPPAVATDAITDAMEANAWRAALRGLCTGRELMTPDECAEHVRHRIESAKSGTHLPVVADRDAIRRVFLAHGFTIKDGQTDLKPYVYEAAEALLRELSPAVAVPEINLSDIRCECCGYMTYHREHMGCIRAASQQAQWQPIETAPADGPFLGVLDCAGERTICTMRLAVAMQKNSVPDNGDFHRERVTHWMPLPPEPQP